MERFTAMEEFLFKATTNMKKYGRRRLRRHWSAKGEPENASDRYTVAKGDHRTFVSKAVMGVFAVFAL